MSILNYLSHWANSLQTNEIQLVAATIQASATIIGGICTLLAALIAIWVTFRQLNKQFEHKIIYEGWTNLQKQLFNFSTTFTTFDTDILGLKYYVTSKNNSLVNGGNLQQYEMKKWNEIMTSYTNLLGAYVELLRAYETNEIIFLPLAKMKKAFIEEFRLKVEDDAVSFFEKFFPQAYGKQQTLIDKVLLNKIDDYWYQVSEMNAFIDDFRIELQNITVGKVLNKKVQYRKPGIGHKLLTKNGVIITKNDSRFHLTSKTKTKLKKILKKVCHFFCK